MARHGAAPLNTPFEGAWLRTPGRLVAVVPDADGAPAEVAGLPLCDSRPVEWPWGLRLRAPDDEADLPSTFARLTEQVARTPAWAAPKVIDVYGGTAFTRTLVCERARMHDRVPALLCDPDPGPDADAVRDRALTAVLSGRADLVGVPA